jgi:hypothetical protein
MVPSCPLGHLWPSPPTTDLKEARELAQTLIRLNEERPYCDLNAALRQDCGRFIDGAALQIAYALLATPSEREILEKAARVALKEGVAFMDSNPVSDPEGTLTAAIQAIRALSPPSQGGGK